MVKLVAISSIRLFLVILFVYAGLSKWINLQQFVADLNNQPFPNWMTRYLVVLIPTLELFAAISLLFSTTVKTGLYLSALLMTVFTMYTVLVLVNGFDFIPCSCGGIINHLTWKQHLLFNSFFLVLAIVGIVLSKKRS